ncbi:enoyl-CoA hydratase/isomerase family protein [Jatrophihabitans sp.]|uniref:enoyl-CoA hydratase/isomerase family protein n=1 Tax=Jatrophihabitans sp. TaxID=1932789 RepID=UPI0030C76FE9|nr:hypothetical protein [Jatrophihabitans sp.]
MIAARDLPEFLRSAQLELVDGVPVAPLVFVDLDDVGGSVPFRQPTSVVLVGVASGALDETARALAERLACTLVSGVAGSEYEIAVDDLAHARATIQAGVTRSPRAALTLMSLLGASSQLSVGDGLVLESLAYSMLLSGAEFTRWRASSAARPIPSVGTEPVLLERSGAALSVTLNRPERRNSFSRAMRDAVIEALELVELDSTIAMATLSGAGPSFCSGGDLDEFGGSVDLASAHLIRLERSAAAHLDRVSDRVTVLLHGACIGAGIEIPSFAGRVVAAPDTVIKLPELAMGLVPGAGGTVGIRRRIGRWRTAWLVLSGEPIDAATAQQWGLVDDVTG